VANRFGIVGDLTSLPVINLTNSDAVAAALAAGQSQYLRYNAINSGIIDAVISRNLGSSEFNISSAINAFVTQYLDRGVAGNTTDELETSFALLLGGSARVLELVQSRLNNAGNLAGLIQDLRTEAELAAAEEPNQHDQGAPSETTGAEPRAKAIAMVTDLRDLLFSFGEVTVENGTIGSIAED